MGTTIYLQTLPELCITEDDIGQTDEAYIPVNEICQEARNMIASWIQHCAAKNHNAAVTSASKSEELILSDIHLSTGLNVSAPPTRYRPGKLNNRKFCNN